MCVLSLGPIVLSHSQVSIFPASVYMITVLFSLVNSLPDTSRQPLRPVSVLCWLFLLVCIHLRLGATQVMLGSYVVT